MDYQVPQFIEVEDKVIGPFTIRQFIYLAGGGGIMVVLLLTLPLIFAIILGGPIVALAVALAFYKVNNKPFIEILEAGFNYYLDRRKYLWKKEGGQGTAPTAPTKVVTSQATPNGTSLSRAKLEELAWKLDVKDTGRDNEPVI